MRNERWCAPPVVSSSNERIGTPAAPASMHDAGGIVPCTLPLIDSTPRSRGDCAAALAANHSADRLVRVARRRTHRHTPLTTWLARARLVLDQFHAPILLASLGRVVRRGRLGRAEPLARQSRRVDVIVRDQELSNRGG